jgi:hypothetical protein
VPFAAKTAVSSTIRPVKRDPVGLPAAWCPACGADYSGDIALCTACGEDCREQLVLVGRLVSIRTRLWLLVSSFAVASIDAGCVALTAGGIDWHRKPAPAGEALLILSWIMLAIIAVGLLAGAAVSPSSRAAASQARVAADGWAIRRRCGRVTLRLWHGGVSVRRHRDRSLDLRVHLPPGGWRTFSETSGLLVPRGTSPGRVIERVRTLHAAATGRRYPLAATDLTHCPECGYVLDVPRSLQRPGRCPECGWAFDEDVVLFGRHGPSFRVIGNASRGRLAKTALIFGGITAVLLILRNSDAIIPVIAPLLVGTRLMRWVSGVGAALVMVSVMIGVSALLFRRPDPNDAERDRRKRAADNQLVRAGPAQLRLSPDGFAQPSGIVYFGYLGPATLTPWDGYAWRVVRDVDGVRVLISQPPGRLRQMLWRLTRRPAWVDAVFRWRPVDFRIDSGVTARQLRAILRRWQPHRERERLRPTPEPFG